MDYETEDWVQGPKKTKYLPIILVFLFLVPILAGVFFAIKNAKEPKLTDKNPISKVTVNTINDSSKPSVTNTIQNNRQLPAAEKTVQSFYDWYLGQTASDRKKFKNRDEINAGVQLKYNSSDKNYDPLICSSEQPSRIDAIPEKTINTTANVVALAHYQSVVPIKIELKLVDDQWKISTINCIDDDGVLTSVENIKKTITNDYIDTNLATFQWKTSPLDKSRSYQTINGKGFEVSQLASDFSIGALMEKIGFETNSLNENGYKKGNVVCIATSKKAGLKTNASIKCGSL